MISGECRGRPKYMIVSAEARWGMLVFGDVFCRSELKPIPKHKNRNSGALQSFPA